MSVTHDDRHRAHFARSIGKEIEVEIERVPSCGDPDTDTEIQRLLAHAVKWCRERAVALESGKAA